MRGSQNDRLIQSIFSVSRLLRERLSKKWRGDMSSLVQLKTLGFIAERKNPTMREIANSLHILSATATDIINRLVKGGLVVRQNDSIDRRIVRITLTREGRRMYGKSMNNAKREVKGLTDVLSEKEKKGLATLLERLIERASKTSVN